MPDTQRTCRTCRSGLPTLARVMAIRCINPASDCFNTIRAQGDTCPSWREDVDPYVPRNDEEAGEAE